MKVLLLTWEFPPVITGGLGMACYGMVKELLKKGIENEQFFIIPDPDPEETVRSHVERLINYATPEGTKLQEDMMKKRMEEIRRFKGGKNPFEGAAEAGWGKAREDLSWIIDR